MSLMTREQIVIARDLKTETVTVPQWGGDVIITELGAGEIVPLYQFIGGDDLADRAALYSRLTVRCAVDEEGNRIFSDDDYLVLNKKHPAAIRLLGETAMRLNGLLLAEEPEKNS